jgi:hypothetical protein
VESVSDGEDVNRAWERENIRTSPNESLGLYELKQYIPRFDEGCLCFLDHRKQANLQWLQDPNQNNVHTPSHIRREDIGHCKNKNEGISER